MYTMPRSHFHVYITAANPQTESSTVMFLGEPVAEQIGRLLLSVHDAETLKSIQESVEAALTQALCQLASQSDAPTSS